MNDRVAEARAAVAPCLPDGVDRGPDAGQRTASVCLFVAGLADEVRREAAARALEQRAVVRPPSVPYGRPDHLARILRAWIALGPDDELTEAEAAAALRLLEGADDLYVTYHLPFLSSYVARFRAQVRLMQDDPAGARAALEAARAARPADVQVLLLYAGAQARQGDAAGALGTLDRIARVWPTADQDSHVVTRARLLRDSLTTL